MLPCFLKAIALTKERLLWNVIVFTRQLFYDDSYRNDEMLTKENYMAKDCLASKSSVI